MDVLPSRNLKENRVYASASGVAGLSAWDRLGTHMKINDA